MTRYHKRQKKLKIENCMHKLNAAMEMMVMMIIINIWQPIPNGHMIIKCDIKKNYGNKK